MSLGGLLEQGMKDWLESSQGADEKSAALKRKHAIERLAGCINEPNDRIPWSATNINIRNLIATTLDKRYGRRNTR